MDKKLALTILFSGVDKLSGPLKNIVGLGKSSAQSLRGLRGELGRVRREMTAASGNVTHLVNRERELEAAIKRRQRLMQIDGKVMRMHAQADRMMSAGRSNMMGGVAMLALPGLAVRSAVDYDKKITLIAQKTGMAADAAGQFGRSMLTVARNARQLPDTVIGGADFLAGKGLGVTELDAMMPVIARFATAWDADIVDSSKAAYAAFSSLNVPLNQTGRALEMMAAAGAAGGFEVKDMAKEFPVLTGALSALGSTGLNAVADLSSALQVIEAQTGDGAAAATNLRNLLAFATTERGIKRFEKFGIDVTAALKKAAAEGRSPIEELIRLSEMATGGDDMKIGELFSNQQAMVAMQALKQRQADYLDIRKQTIESAGLTEEEFARMAATSASNWQALQGSVQTLSIALGTHLLPLVTRAADWLARTTNAVGEWANRNSRLAGTLLQLVVGLGAARFGLGALQFAFGGILKPMATAWGWFMKLRTIGAFAKVAPIAAKAFMLIRTGALFMASGVMKAGLLLLANPMILAIVAIVAVLGFAGYMIYKHWDTIKAGFFAAVDWLTDLGGKMLGYGKAIINGLVDGILAAPGAVWNALKSVVMGGINGIKSFLGIQSPSRLFMEFGGHMTDGLAIGVDRGGRRPIAAVDRLARGVGKAATGLTAGMALAAAPAHAAGAAHGASAAPKIEITINLQPGEDAQELARRVASELERRWAAQRRQGYYDA